MNSNAPNGLREMLGSDSAKIIVESKRMKPLSAMIKDVFGGLVFLLLGGGGLIAIWTHILLGNTLELTINNNASLASLDHLSPLTIPTIFLSLFALVGAFLIVRSLGMLFASGPYYAVMDTALIEYTDKQARRINWEQFSGVTKIAGNNITFELRTGREVKRNKKKVIVPDKIYLVGMQDVFEIEKIFNDLIKKHDPTPMHDSAF